MAPGRLEATEPEKRCNWETGRGCPSPCADPNFQANCDAQHTLSGNLILESGEAQLSH